MILELIKNKSEKQFGIKSQKMPKIMSIPGQNDHQLQRQISPNNKFSQIQNNPNIGNQKYYAPIVPIHEVNYNPEFSKSPLASVQMSRRAHSRAVDPRQNVQHYNMDQDQHVNNDKSHSKWDWKTILCWALAALAIIGLAVGLYFVIDSVLGKQEKASPNTPIYAYTDPRLQTNRGSSTGISPIIVNPIPYNNMYTPGSPDNSGSSLTYDYGNSYTTSPTVTSYSTATTVTQPFANRNSLSTDSRTQWTADYSDNSITPLDVFPGRTY